VFGSSELSDVKNGEKWRTETENSGTIPLAEFYFYCHSGIVTLKIFILFLTVPALQWSTSIAA
jgi:hypothetical protein